MRGNTAADRFTVVVLPFSNDPTNAVQSSIAEALASDYEVNVVSSCRKIEIPTAGNHDRNVEAARKRADSLLDKYQADMLIFGTLRRAESGHATDESAICSAF
jgi:hypothetical protein